MISHLLAFLITATAVGPVLAQQTTLDVDLTGIRHANGTVRVGLYQDPKTFRQGSKAFAIRRAGGHRGHRYGELRGASARSLRDHGLSRRRRKRRTQRPLRHVPDRRLRLVQRPDRLRPSGLRGQRLRGQGPIRPPSASPSATEPARRGPGPSPGRGANLRGHTPTRALQLQAFKAATGVACDAHPDRKPQRPRLRPHALAGRGEGACAADRACRSRGDRRAQGGDGHSRPQGSARVRGGRAVLDP